MKDWAVVVVGPTERIAEARCTAVRGFWAPLPVKGKTEGAAATRIVLGGSAASTAAHGRVFPLGWPRS